MGVSVALSQQFNGKSFNVMLYLDFSVSVSDWESCACNQRRLLNTLTRFKIEAFPLKVL
jgi:hypothetical protein